MKKNNGTFLVFIAAVLFSIGGLMVKIIPWSAMALNGARCSVSVIVLLIYTRIVHHKLVINKAVMIGAMCSSVTNILYMLANKMTTAANTIVLQYTAPIFIILLMWLIYKERPKKMDITACICVFIGIIFFFVDSMSSGNMLGNILALISGVTYAGVFMLNTSPNADPISSVIFGHGISACVGIPFMLTQTQFSGQIIAGVLVLGVFQLAVAYICFCTGLRTTPPVTASLVSGIEPVLNPVLVAIFYHEYIGPVSIMGAAIVICSILAYNVIKAKNAHSKKAVDAS